MGIYSEEEALAKCAANGNRERRMVLAKPLIKMVGDDENKVPVVCIYPERYTEEDLILDYLFNNNESDNEDDELPFDTEEESKSDNGLDWLNNI